jgi:hypothetical protein
MLPRCLLFVQGRGLDLLTIAAVLYSTVYGCLPTHLPTYLPTYCLCTSSGNAGRRRLFLHDHIADYAIRQCSPTVPR